MPTASASARASAQAKRAPLPSTSSGRLARARLRASSRHAASFGVDRTSGRGSDSATVVAACAVLLFASAAFAAGPKTYQVTGPVLELKDDVIVVQKGKEKWEIAKGAAKVTGELKVGAKHVAQAECRAEVWAEWEACPLA